MTTHPSLATNAGEDAALVIRHHYEDGTAVEGTTRNSPAHLALKDHPSWVWSRYASAWLLRSSRHHPPKQGKIDEVERLLVARRYQLSRDIDPSMPAVEQRETELADRLTCRTDRLAQQAVRAGAEDERRRAAADVVFDNIPTGRPLLVGHHSYAADLRRRNRAWDNLGKANAADEQATQLRSQAESTAAHMGARYSPETVGNRLEKLTADIRRLRRELHGQPGWIPDPDNNSASEPAHVRGMRYPDPRRAEKLRAEITELQDQLRYWGQVAREQQAECGPARGPDTVEIGDSVTYRGMHLPVRKVNRKSVTVPNPNFPEPPPGQREHTWTIAYYKLTDHRKPR